MRLKLTRISWSYYSLHHRGVHVYYKVIIYYAFCLDVAQGYLNGAPNKTWTHSWRLIKLANHYTTRGAEEKKDLTKLQLTKFFFS